MSEKWVEAMENLRLKDKRKIGGKKCGRESERSQCD